jgi:hypothetical protein
MEKFLHLVVDLFEFESLTYLESSEMWSRKRIRKNHLAR